MKFSSAPETMRAVRFKDCERHKREAGSCSREGEGLAAQLTCISPITDEPALLLGVLGRRRDSDPVEIGVYSACPLLRSQTG